jgi:hypothetical protein
MAEGFVAGLAYTTFKDDVLHLYAVVRCLEIIPRSHGACRASSRPAIRQGNRTSTLVGLGALDRGDGTADRATETTDS